VIVDIVAEFEALPEPDADICWLLKVAQLIAVVPEHQLVVAIGSVPIGDMGLDGSDMWLWVNDVIVPALR
jgi:hypothetical protein